MRYFWGERIGKSDISRISVHINAVRYRREGKKKKTTETTTPTAASRMYCEAKHRKMTPFVFNRFSLLTLVIQLFLCALGIDELKLVSYGLFLMRPNGSRLAQFGFVQFERRHWIVSPKRKFQFAKYQIFVWKFGNCFAVVMEKYYLHFNKIFQKMGSQPCSIDATQELFFCIFLIKILKLSMCVWAEHWLRFFLLHVRLSRIHYSQLKESCRSC